MGRIHRYGQKAPTVIILNLLAAATREGKVLETLLGKLEIIRKELKSDKVFDVIGRLFQDVSIKDYMEMTLEKSTDDVVQDLAGRLTVEQVKAIAAQEKRVYGEGGDVKKELPRVRADMERAALIRLMPGYVRRYMERVLPLVGIGIDGSFDAAFEFSHSSRMPSTPCSALWRTPRARAGPYAPCLGRRRGMASIGCIPANPCSRPSGRWLPTSSAASRSVERCCSTHRPRPRTCYTLPVSQCNGRPILLSPNSPPPIRSKPS